MGFKSSIEGSNPSLSATVRIFCNAPVAQLDRVLGYEPRGREFESLRARHLKQRVRYKNLARFVFLAAKPKSSPPKRRAGIKASKVSRSPAFLVQGCLHGAQGRSTGIIEQSVIGSPAHSLRFVRLRIRRVLTITRSLPDLLHPMQVSVDGALASA